MFERFTDRARKVMALANQEAMRFNHEYIGTEHILLGLVQEGSGVGASVLKNLDVDLYKVRKEIEKLLETGSESVTSKLPQTPRAKKVIELAIEESRNLNHNYIGTEHMLVGLLREEEGIAAQVLVKLGVKLAEVREEVLNLLGTGSDASRPEPERPLASFGELITQLLTRFDSQIAKLTHENEEAVNDGDCERAAKIRDEWLKLIESKEQAIKKILGIE